MLMRLRMLKLSVGKGRQITKQLYIPQSIATEATERAGYVLYRALVVIGFGKTLRRDPREVHTR